MKKQLAAMMAVLFGCFLGVTMAAEAAEAAKPAHEKGEEGVITGVITAMNHGKIRVKSETETLELMPFWRGGNPADGGGYDKGMMGQLEKFKVGDRVKVAWIFEEHARIKSIEKVGGEAVK